MNDGTGIYYQIVDAYITFTAPEVESVSSIGQLVDINNYKPQGYKATIIFNEDLTVEGLLAASPISVYYDQVNNERSKNIVISYYGEDDNGEFEFLNAAVVNVKETEIYEGIVLAQYVNQNLYRPNRVYYDDGVLVDHNFADLITYDTLELNYTVQYHRSVNTIYLEYYVGSYPDWYRMSIDTISTKYQSSYDNNFNINSLGINLNKHKRAEYYDGIIVNAEQFDSYASLVNIGVIQVAYDVIDYPIIVNYYKDNDTTNVIATETVNVNALMFFSNTILSDIADLETHRPEGYQLDLINSYHGEMNLSALTQASPISVMYTEIEADRTKNIIVRYKKELSSTFSTINTSILTIKESDCAGGVRLKDVIPLNTFKPDYYDSGYLDGASSTAVITYDEIASDYTVIYMASYYVTPVRYYTDDIHDDNWIGSANLRYRVIDFTTTTTLYDLGLNLNQYKPSYSDNGRIEYHGVISFMALQEIDAIPIVYDTIVEPGGDDDIKYPNKMLYLTANDLGPYEYLHPTWIMNHAYINTGITCDDITKLTSIIDAECIAVDQLVSRNYRFAYLFGSKSNAGVYYLAHYNAAQYIDNVTLGQDLYDISHLVAGNTPTINVNARQLIQGGQAYEDIWQDFGVIPAPNGLGGWKYSGSATGQDGILNKDLMNFYTIAHGGLYNSPSLWKLGNNNDLTSAGAPDLFSTSTGFYPIGNHGLDPENPNSGTTTSFVQLNHQYRMVFEPIPIYYPIYLYACNSFGSYEGGLSGYGITSARFYYNGILIRDFIPVETYDRIGDQVAPSNCLYDKVSKTFFEDATGMNSFNIENRDIRDEFQILHCYVNYYRGNTLFKTSIIYFRGDEFKDPHTLSLDTANYQGDIYDKFEIEANQPRYYGTGVIQNISTLEFTWDKMQNQVYNVVYPSLDQQITVNYYTEINGEQNLIATEDITINEQTFYQSPSFGDIIRINKYKPDGYECNFEFSGSKITLNQMVVHSPYNIIYTPVNDTLTTYTTTLIYKKKVFGVRTYEELGRIILTLDETQFRDGEYLDYYIDLNAYKPANYYLDGESYGWYLMDERLDDPTALQESYEIYYMPAILHKDVNYYTDDWDEANLIASTTWDYQIDDFDPEEPFYLIDILPNEYTNKYRPSNCDGGVLQDSNTALNFEDLVALTEIAFVYDTVEEPNDPESAMYEQKVLYFGDPWHQYPQYSIWEIHHDLGVNFGGRIPYIDLGYKPKDLSRLRVELTGYALPYGINIDGKINDYSLLDNGYAYFFGYYGIQGIDVEHYGRADRVIFNGPVRANKYADYPKKGWDPSNGSKGVFAIRPRMPKASSWVYTASGPQDIDGQTYYTGGALTTAPTNEPYYARPGIYAQYRKGLRYDTDIDYNTIDAFKTYALEYDYRFSLSQCMWGLSNEILTDGWMWDYTTQNNLTNHGYSNTPMANPFTIVMDAYHDYISIYDYGHSNTPSVYNITNTDNDIFEDREQPNGSLTLFRTTNPYTGKVNIMPFDYISYAYPGLLYGGYGNLLQRGVQQNPYAIKLGGQFDVEISAYELVGYSSGNTEKDTYGNALHKEQIPIVRETTATINLLFMDFEFPSFPQISAAAIWGLKIYDRDRLVRHLVPVAEGDVIYDYTMPANGLFDLVTEIFFTNNNKGGTYSQINSSGDTTTVEIGAGDVLPLRCIPDPMIYGKITTNYYDYDNSFINHQFVNVPMWFNGNNTTIEDILKFNDFKPDDYRLDGWLDIGQDLEFRFEDMKLSDIFEMGTANIYYRLRTFTKTVTYYQGNTRIGTRDIFYSIYDIENATTLADLGVNVDEFYEPKFAHGRLVFNEDVIADDDIAAFIDAPSPIVIYDKLTAQEAPNLFYVEYYRGGAYDDGLITLDPNDNNYLDCNLTAKVLNPSGAIKYEKHFHSALYEDEDYDYFIPYQVHVDNHYTGIHNGPGRMYKTLANIVVEDTYTIIQERNGWGKLKEYRNGWILLNQTTPITGPGQNPEYDVAGSDVATIPFASEITVTKLTIDRLWAWVPAVESWVKTEDISYDQSGKLYNALAIQVIDLDTVDWNNVSSLADIGIEPDKFQMRFHNASGYTYSGAYTKEAFQALHNIEFVYPETVYNYTCIYYKDNKAAANELGRSAFSCTISDWNPDWDTFISTSWQVDENEDPISPTLYRDTPITLTWDYFGFERNAFKPTGYYDGIYLWNPRTWDKDNVKFTFDELIKCGTQYVIYPIFKPDLYKIWVQRNYLGKCVQSQTTNSLGQHSRTLSPAVNAGIQLNLAADGGPSSFYGYKTDAERMCYDVYRSGELKKDLEYLTTVTKIDSGWPTVNDLNSIWDYTRVWQGGASNRFDTHIRSLFREEVRGIGSVLGGIEEGDMFIINTSNHREYPTEVFGLGGVVKQKESKFYVPVSADATDFVKIEDNTNLSSYDMIPVSGLTYAMQPDNSNNHMLISANSSAEASRNFLYSGIIYDMISYYNFEMVHYWIPVPKGMWYRYNGEDLRIPDNGMFDLLTGDFECSFRVANDTPYSREWTPGTWVDGNDFIYYRNQEITNTPYNYFTGWSFAAESINQLVNITSNTIMHTYPDEYAPELRTIYAGTVVPVSGVTSDSTSNVVGEWYYSCDGWFKSSDTELYQGEFNPLDLTEDYKLTALVPGEHAAFTSYKDPSAVLDSSNESFTYGMAPAAVQVYYNYSNNGTEFYFTGNTWIPKAYTDQNRIAWNRNYAISANTDYYQLPIANASYKLGRYLPGDRITILYVCANNEVWGWTGQGWIGLESNVSEVL